MRVVNKSQAPDANTDLGKAQRTLLAALSQDQAGTPNKTTLTNDGTLILLRAASRDISAQAVAEYLTHILAPDTDALVIAERDGIIIDNALARVGAPRCGFRHYSRFRAAGQVLKLCLGLVWAPVNPRLLQQFLLHPVGPLNRYVRGRLAQAVAEQPGVGGQRWREELARSLERIGEKETPEQVARIEQAVRFWLESPRHAPHDGAPIQALIERAQACADWLARRAHNAEQASERESFATAHRQARDLIDALGHLSDQGRSHVPKVELDRLLDEATGPLSDPEAFSETGHVLALEQPAAAIEPRDHVVWWDLAPRPPLGRYPWSAKELAALHAHGVELPDLDTLHRQEARHALRPVLAARRQLVLVCHEREGRDHPLLSQLVSLFDGLPEVVLDSHLTGAEAEPVIPQLQVPTLELPPRPLPAKRRWWHLPEDARPAPRETESYSSLEKLLCHPHIWLLQYAARLREGSAGNLPSEPLLHGNLAHHVFERFFTAHPDWRDMQEDQVLSWLSAMLDELIETEAVVLLGPGQAVRRERVVTTIRRALLSLLAHLRSARIASVQPESPATAPFEDGAITGTIDLLLTDEDGRETVLDVKWGSEKYRLDLLGSNQPLQLATYAYLRRQAGGSQTRWPATAFFIVETGDVLAQDNADFPERDHRPKRRRRRRPRALVPRPAQLRLAPSPARARRSGSHSRRHRAGSRGRTARRRLRRPRPGAEQVRPLHRPHRLGALAMTSEFSHVSFTSAGAGSGKTYYLTEYLEQALAAGRARPGGVVATTFTVKAAAEIEQKVRKRLIDHGHYALEQQIGQALIGTVHSVCERLLQRFSFELGLSPQLHIVSLDDAADFFNQAVDEVLDGDRIAALNRVARRLGVTDWLGMVKKLADAARSNDIAPQALVQMGPDNADALLAHFPNPTGGDPQAELLRAMDDALAGIDLETDTTKGTKKYVETLRSARGILDRPDCPWIEWIRLSKEKATKKSDDWAATVRAAAARYDVHPAFQADIRTYIETLFDIAGQSLERFQAIKTERGLVDFTDMEQLMLHALDNAQVRERLGDELELLLVDEFQDTNPMQLAVFVKLAQLADEVVFVGDVKQAIYAFRGCDPALVFDTLEGLTQRGSNTEVLGFSWRSRPALVRYVNHVFSQVFQGQIPPERVVLEPQRPEYTEEPAVMQWRLAGKKEEQMAALAAGVAALVASGHPVVDPDTDEERPVQWGDIAVLARTNDHVEAIAAALTAQRIPTKMTLPGLSQTPEVCLARACLRYLNDPADTLATAEIIALATSSQPEEWLRHRMTSLGRDEPATDWGRADYPVIRALAELKHEIGMQSPLETVARALNLVDIRKIVTAWGPDETRVAQRQRNLDAFLNLAVEYEKHSEGQQEAASLTGFLLWLQAPRSPELDLQPTVTSGNAVHVLTYHRAKGLEWPVVITTDFLYGDKSRLWDVRVESEGEGLDLDQPLAGRTIRYWPDLFGNHSTGIPVLDAIEASPEGERCQVRQRRRAQAPGLRRPLPRPRPAGDPHARQEHIGQSLAERLRRRAPHPRRRAPEPLQGTPHPQPLPRHRAHRPGPDPAHLRPALAPRTRAQPRLPAPGPQPLGRAARGQRHHPPPHRLRPPHRPAQRPGHPGNRN